MVVTASVLVALFKCHWMARRSSAVWGGDGIPTVVIECGGGPTGALAVCFRWWCVTVAL